MAISNTKLVQFKKSLSLSLLAFITLFLMVLNLVNSSSDSLSFTFKNFKPDPKDLIFQGEAFIPSSSEAVLKLTKPNQSLSLFDQGVGRALFGAPLHLWDNTTGKVASFETVFTFVISTPNNNAGDGLAFFLAPPSTTIPPFSGDGYLGLFCPIQLPLFPGCDNVVAVEFDTYVNAWDPSHRHVGIDVNSVRSSSSERWEWRNGETVTASITYKSATKELTVVSSYPNGETVTVSHVVDFKTVLPEWVRIGFSGSVGVGLFRSSSSNNILSWSFSSRLDSSESKKEDMYIARYV